MHGAGNVLKNPVKTMEIENKEVEQEILETPVEETETIESLKAQLAKEQEEKEHYKEMGLKYKKEAKEEEPQWDDDSEKFQKQTLSKAEELAAERARQTVEEFNEKAGIAKFQEAHPDVDMKEVLANYQPKNGKFSADSVARDLERALVLHQYDTGKLSTEESFQKGKKKGAAEAKMADLNTISKFSQKPTPQGETVSETAKEMAGQMHVDPEKLAEESQNVIKI